MRALLLLAILLVAGCSSPTRSVGSPSATAGPSATATPAPALQPGDVRLALGDSWAYRVTGGNADEGTQETVVADQTGTTAILSSRTTTGGASPSTSRIEARQGDLAIVSIQSGNLGFTITYDPPLALVIPASDHQQTSNATLEGPTGRLRADVNLTVTFVGREKTTVPGGTFDTLRYHVVIRTSGAANTTQESDIWFAPMVKAPVKTVDGNGRTMQLTGYHVEPPTSMGSTPPVATQPRAR